MNEKIDDVLGRIGNDVVSIIGMSRNLGSDYEKLIAMLSKTPEGKEFAKHLTKGFGETGGLRDRVILEHRDKNGKLIAKRDSGWHTDQCLTNLGFASVAGLLLTDVGDTAYDYLAIGTGAVAADPTDVALGGEEARKAGTGTRVLTAVANDTANLVATFAAADGLAGVDAITEVGMFNDPAAGTMLMRQTFAVLNINWDAGDTLQTTVKIQAKQGA